MKVPALTRLSRRPLKSPRRQERKRRPRLLPGIGGAGGPCPKSRRVAEAMPTTSGIGVLLVNLGTPDAAEPPAMRRYLKEFLTDPPRDREKLACSGRWCFNGIILPLRSRRKARRLQKNLEQRQGRVAAQDHHPLAGRKTLRHSRAARQTRHRRLGDALRQPSIASRLEALVGRGCDRILVMPLYPQYAAPTTATVCDEVFRFLMGLRRQPALRIMPAYYDDPYYIEVLASSLKAELKGLPFEPDVIVASYHGMPQDYVHKGDPYESQCVRTTQLLREQLRLDEAKLMMTLSVALRPRPSGSSPTRIQTVKALAKKGVKNLVVMTPGFSADCLETLEEIAVENAQVFKRYGGKNFAAIPCLNDSEAGMLMIWQLAMRELKGWV